MERKCINITVIIVIEVYIVFMVSHRRLQFENQLGGFWWQSSFCYVQSVQGWQWKGKIISKLTNFAKH